jgi:hypothetical protein
MKQKSKCILICILQLCVSSAWAGHWVDWNEEALLSDGRKVLVSRNTYYEFQLVCGDEGSGMSTFCNSPKTYRISFEHPDSGDEIEWEEDDLSPVSLQIINKVPYLVAHGPDAPVAMVAYPVCNGTPYIFYKYVKGKSWRSKKSWELLDEASIPDEIFKKNLSFAPEEHSTKKVLSEKRVRRKNEEYAHRLGETGWLDTPRNFDEWKSGNRWQFARSQRSYYKGPGTCKDLKPLPDPKGDETRKLADSLEASARTISGNFVGLDDSQEVFTSSQFRKLQGSWWATWVRPNCKEIVKGFTSPNDIHGPYAYEITFSNGNRTQITLPRKEVASSMGNKKRWAIDTPLRLVMATCSMDMVYVIRQSDGNNFIISRYRSTGDIVDVTKVALEQNKMPTVPRSNASLFQLLQVHAVTNDEIVLEFARLDYAKKNVDGTIVLEEGRTLTGSHLMVIWKARFNVRFP